MKAIFSLYRGAARRLRSLCERPRGQATTEYVVVAVSVVLVWLAIERSPDGFASALFKLISQYKFLISIPW